MLFHKTRHTTYQFSITFSFSIIGQDKSKLYRNTSLEISGQSRSLSANNFFYVKHKLMCVGHCVRHTKNIYFKAWKLISKLHILIFLSPYSLAAISIKIYNLLICFCSFDLSCPDCE